MLHYSLVAAAALFSMLASAAPADANLDGRDAVAPTPFAVKIPYAGPGSMKVNNTWLEAASNPHGPVGFNNNRPSGTIFVVASNGDLKWAKADYTATVALGGNSQQISFSTPQELASGKRLCIKCSTKQRQFLCSGGSYEPNMSKLMACQDTPLGFPSLWLVDKNYSSSKCQSLQMLSTTNKQT